MSARVSYWLRPGFTSNYYYGSRRFPYAVISHVGANGHPYNPLTFADIDADRINTDDGAYPRSPLWANDAFEVHNVGEVWASALFEVRARFIARLGFAIGNQRILQFVTDGMKLDPVNPTFLDGRDSIISAANAGGGTAADIEDIRTGFAVRGMGIRAQIRDISDSAVTALEDFYVTEPVFTDTLSAGSTLIKAVYITELRDRIAALRNAAPMAAYPWTRTLTPQITSIRSVDITEMRQALQDVYDAGGQTRPTYSTNAGVADLIRAADIVELRAAVVNFEDAGGCAATAALQGHAQAPQELTAFRGLRDQVLASSAFGRAATSDYYRHSPEVVRLLFVRPRLAAEIVSLADELSPISRQMTAAATNGRDDTPLLTADLISRVESVLDQLQAVGSPALVADLTRFRQGAALGSAAGLSVRQYWQRLASLPAGYKKAPSVR